MFKSVGIWIGAAFAILITLYDRLRRKNKKLEEDNSNYEDRINKHIKHNAIVTELAPRRANRDARAKNKAKENETMMEMMRNEDDNAGNTVDHIRELLDDPEDFH